MYLKDTSNTLISTYFKCKKCPCNQEHNKAETQTKGET